MRRRLAAVPAVLLLVPALAACGGDDSGSDDSDGSGASSISGVTVTGDVGEKPEVEVEEGFDVSETESVNAVEGDGPAVETGGQVLLHLTIVNGSSGDPAFSSYDAGPAQEATVSPEQLPGGIDAAITGQPRGSRVVTVGTVEEAIGPQGAEQIGLKPDDDVVFISDIISVTPEDVLDGPEGEETEPPEGLPTVETDGDVVTGFDFSDAPKPSDQLEVAVLIEGDGAAIPEGEPRLVTMNYIGQVYDAPKPFDNSFEEGTPATYPIGNGSLIPGWDQALAGVKAGSRVLMTVPPELGYGEQGNPNIDVSGKDTLVFVVDVLGVDS